MNHLLLTQECSESEGKQPDIDDWRRDVDKPVGQEWSYPEKYDVIQHVLPVLIHLERANIATLSISGLKLVST